MIFNTLVREPYNLSFAEIRKLTPWQVRHVLLRDPALDRKPKQHNAFDLYRTAMRKAGLTDQQILARWAKVQEQHKSMKQSSASRPRR